MAVRASLKGSPLLSSATRSYQYRLEYIERERRMRPNGYQQVELMRYLILSLVGFIPKQDTDSSPLLGIRLV